MSCRPAVVMTLCLVIVLAGAGVASGAQLVDRNATGVRLATNTKGEALITYRKGGAEKHVLVWGAINAAAPVKGYHQVKFSLDYAGGYGKYHKTYWKTFGASCGKYDGPPLLDVVAACKSFDGSYWAVQEWQQALPDLGFTPWTAALSAGWLEVSHWIGDLPTLEVHLGWVYSGFQQIFGRYMYK